ncbi:MAG TPA: radical SAM protein [Polyangia bacterium]
MSAPRRVLFLTAPELPRRSRGAVLPPLANLLLTAALRRAGYEVERHDLDARLMGDGDQMARLEACAPAVIDGYCAGTAAAPGLDALFDALLAGVGVAAADAIAVSAKRPAGAKLLAARLGRLTRVPIIVGGDLDNDAAGALRTTPAIDATVASRGEAPLLGYLEMLAGDRARAEVPGLYYRDGGDVTHNDSPRFDVAEQVAPDLTDLAVGDYLCQAAHLDQPPNPGFKLVLPYYFIEGCPFGCSYCRALKHEARVKPPGRVVDELAALATATGARDFAFFNNTINVSSAFVREFASALTSRRLDLRWSDSATFVRSSEEQLGLLRDSGCICLTFGLESASPRVLRRMRKAHTPDVAARILRRSHELGIWNRVNVIVGFPGETDEDFAATTAFLEQNAETIDTISISTFYLVDSAVLREPGSYGIKVRDWVVQPERRHILGAYSFDEIDGPTWEEREQVARARAAQLKESFQRRAGARDIGNLYEVHDVYGYCASKAEVRARLRDRRGLRLVLFTGAGCNNRCGDCSARSLAPWSASRTTARLMAEIDTAGAAGYSRAVLVGGEPTIRPDLTALLDHLRARRFDEVTLVTNGRMLAYPGFARRLRQRGVQVVIKAPGLDAAAHDAAAGVGGAYEQTRRGLANWRALGGGVRLLARPALTPLGTWADPLAAAPTGVLR